MDGAEVLWTIVIILLTLFAVPALFAWLMVTFAGAAFWPAFWVFLIWNIAFKIIYAIISN